MFLTLQKEIMNDRNIIIEQGKAIKKNIGYTGGKQGRIMK